ncbi:MAG: hypothetical protein ACRDAM_04470 [Casimicrobium sp.]
MDAAIAASPVEPVNAFRKGEPRSSRPNARRATTSGIVLSVSEAEFEDSVQQEVDAITFLREHNASLKELLRVRGVAKASLDFGIEMRNVIVQTDQFSAELIREMAEIGLGLELTQFPPFGKHKRIKQHRRNLRKNA